MNDVHIIYRRGHYRRLALRINREGEVTLTIPLLATDDEVERFLSVYRSRLLCALCELERRRQATAALPPVTPERVEQFAAYLADAIPRWRERMQAPPVVWKVRKMISKWASCNYRYNPALLTFSVKMARLPRELIDLIIVHELAHLFVPNHSPQFHALVREYIPDEPLLNKQLHVYI